MFIAKNNDLVIQIADTQEELENKLKYRIYTSIEETDEHYQFINGQYLTDEEASKKRENDFKSKFFHIPTIESVFVGGWYRKTPKGYQSAVESLNSAFNIVNILGKLPANILQFYIEPDFTKPEECTEEWLVEHAFKNDEMSIQQFGAFYAEFLTAWNREEH